MSKHPSELSSLFASRRCYICLHMGRRECSLVLYQHVASRCTRCEGYASIAFGLAQVDSVALAKTKGLLPCVQREDLVRHSS